MRTIRSVEIPIERIRRYGGNSYRIRIELMFENICKNTCENRKDVIQL